MYIRNPLLEKRLPATSKLKLRRSGSLTLPLAPSRSNSTYSMVMAPLGNFTDTLVPCREGCLKNLTPFHHPHRTGSVYLKSPLRGVPDYRFNLIPISDHVARTGQSSKAKDDAEKIQDREFVYSKHNIVPSVGYSGDC